MVEVSDKKKVFESDEIWNEINRLPIDVFAVANQLVADHVKKIDLPGSDLYVKLSSSAVLPALETTLSNGNLTRGRKYEVIQAEGYVVVKRLVDQDAKVQKVLAAMDARNK